MEEIDTYIAKLIEDAREQFDHIHRTADDKLMQVELDLAQARGAAIWKWNRMVDEHAATFERWDFIDPPASIGCRKI